MKNVKKEYNKIRYAARNGVVTITWKENKMVQLKIKSCSIVQTKTYVELLDVRAAGLGCRDDIYTDNMDGASTSAMASTHITIARSDGSSCGELTVLAVHVVSTRTRIITQPDTEVLDRIRMLLRNLHKIMSFDI